LDEMLRPEGVAVFTFLSESYVDSWLAGALDHYGSYSREAKTATARSLREEGHGFASLTSGYGGEPLYGIAFTSPDMVRREVEAAGLDLLATPAELIPAFGQDLALVRKPVEKERRQGTGPEVLRDVSLVAIYDPRCYAPAKSNEGSHLDMTWARLAAADPPRPLPTELGFGDPRVPEVREAQAALAREHAVDAFCYVYPWSPTGPRWDAPWRDMVATGRPDFSFCLMISLEGSEPISAAAAERLIDDVSAGLHDHRYLHVDRRKLVVVRDLARLTEPRSTTAIWRAAALARGLGEIHLCAAEPVPAERPEDVGCDSFLEATVEAADAAGVAAALARPWPEHRFFRTVECRRDAAGWVSLELYEHWLRSAVDATRSCGEALVFVNSWNDWLRGYYLEPDDRDGRAALVATRRAARGPSSGLVLLRQLRDALGTVGDRAGAVLQELEQVLALHEHTRDGLLATVEVALGRKLESRESPRWVKVASRHLPPSNGRYSLDRIGSLNGPDLWDTQEPISLSGDKIQMAGWAHTGTCSPGEVDLFLALECLSGTGDCIVRVAERVNREDVAAAFPGCPANCGFDMIVNLVGLAPGTYRVAIVQRTPNAAYRDATAATVRLDGIACSNA
jgi:hypothetical protein